MASQGKNKPSQGESEMAKRFKSNPFVFIGTFFILVIVVIAFVFVTPAGAVFGGMMDGDLTFGYYDRQPISFAPGNFFANEYEWRLRQWQAWMGGELSPWIEHQIWRESFEAAAVHTAILRTMQRAATHRLQGLWIARWQGCPCSRTTGAFPRRCTGSLTRQGGLPYGGR